MCLTGPFHLLHHHHGWEAVLKLIQAGAQVDKIAPGLLDFEEAPDCQEIKSGFIGRGMASLLNREQRDFRDRRRIRENGGVLGRESGVVDANIVDGTVKTVPGPAPCTEAQRFPGLERVVLRIEQDLTLLLLAIQIDLDAVGRASSIVSHHHVMPAR